MESSKGTARYLDAKEGSLGSTATPEPSSVLLLGAGLFGFGMLHRSRRKAA